MHEYFLLAGKLLRWKLLYDEYPPYDSWVWKVDPDGADWLRRVQRHELQNETRLSTLLDISHVLDPGENLDSW
jgi:hypothetical protein